jgi:hypothetical protein
MSDLNVTVTLEPQVTEVSIAPFVVLPSSGGGAVDSVNAQTGAVVLDAADVGADPAGAASAAQSAAISTAAADATSKADASQAAAIAAAAADATTKVNAEAAARATAITAAIDALVAGAPGALDTLAELAAELADDHDALDALIVAVSAKAPLVAPALTGAATLDGVALETTAGAQAKANAAAAASQPLDSDLSAIAALSTTSYGRAFLALADSAAGRTALGLGSAATQASTAFDAAGAAAAAQAASQPLDSDLTAIAALSTTSFGRALLALADAAALRTTAGLVLGTDIYSKAAVDSGFQPLDSDLTTIAGLTATTDTFLQSKASAWTTRTPAQVKTDLVLVKGDVGLGNVDNTADTAKPVSTAQAAADAVVLAKATWGSINQVGLSGKYTIFTSPNNALTGQTTNNTLRLIPVFIGAPLAVDRIGTGITVVGQAGATVRLAVYDDAGGYPNNPVIDAVVAADVVATVEATISYTFAVGWYHVGGVVQNAATTQPTIRTTGTTFNGGFPLFWSSGANATAGNHIGNVKASVSGALPAWSPTGPDPTPVAPRVHFRIA